MDGNEDLDAAFLRIIEMRESEWALRNASATALRALAASPDPRTVALVLGMPTGLIVLLRFVFDGQIHTFQPSRRSARWSVSVS